VSIWEMQIKRSAWQDEVIAAIAGFNRKSETRQ